MSTVQKTIFKPGQNVWIILSINTNSVIQLKVVEATIVDHFDTEKQYSCMFNDELQSIHEPLVFESEIEAYRTCLKAMNSTIIAVQGLSRIGKALFKKP